MVEPGPSLPDDPRAATIARTDKGKIAMNESDPWVTYAWIRKLANSNRQSSRARAADEALDTLLDMIERGRPISTQQAKNLLLNRARKQRVRAQILAQHADILSSAAANDNARLEARSELIRCREHCDDREWRVLVAVALGHTSSSIALTERVPEATIKTWVRRARIKLMP